MKRLYDEKQAIWRRMQDIWDAAAAEDRPMDEAESREYEALAQKLDEIDKRIAAQERHERLAREMESVRPVPVLPGAHNDGSADDIDASYRQAFVRYLRYGMAGIAPEERQLLRTHVVPGEHRAQASSPGSAGGYLIPQEFGGRLIETLKSYSGVRQAVGEENILRTTTGAEIVWPTVNDTANKGRLIGENQPATTTDLTFGRVALRAFLYSSDVVLVPVSLLQDEAVDLEGYLARALGARLGRIQNEHLTTGDGNGKPSGIVTEAPVGVTAASATAITYGELVDLEHSVDPAYRNGPRVGYMLHDTTLAALRKLADGQGRPLWVPSLAQGVPNTLNGWPYWVNNDMPQIAANQKSILFGSFSQAYVIRELEGVTLLRLEERWADALQVGFLAFMRFDGKMVDSGAVKALQQAAN